MGGRGSRSRPITIALLGLDGAGKTTTVKALEKTSIDFVAPTLGFSQCELAHKNGKIKLFDLGGAKSFREAWHHYYDDAYGFIYVIDSSEQNRFDENREELIRLLQEDKVKNKPILILANKQDKPDALDRNGILEDLKIERLVNQNQNLCRVELCTAKLVSSNGKTPQIDQPIQNGFDWLIKTINENYDALHKRVEQDVQNRNEVEQKAKSERQKNVQRIREERAQQESQEDDEQTSDGFVPISQAVKNAEIRSTVATNVNGEA